MYPRYFDVPRVSSYHQGADDGAAIRKNLGRSGERLPLHKIASSYTNFGRWTPQVGQRS
jgi:hypothetical protein